MADLDAIREKWLKVCGYCDAGIGDCSHPDEDYRPTMLHLVEELSRYYEFHDRLDEAAREASPVMLAELVIRAAPDLPVAFPAVHAGWIRRQLAKVIDHA